MFSGRRLVAWLRLWLWLFAAAAQATPAEDYARGQQAYAQGDVVAAMASLKAASQAGHAPAMAMLAFILDRSDFGPEVVTLFQRAADLGDPDGCAGLAGLYLSGRGVAKDENAAFRYFSKAADAGHVASIGLVAGAHLGGVMSAAAPKDDALALAAVRRAAEQSHLPSIDAMTRAYELGRWGLAADAKQAADWRARAVELRSRKPAAPAKAAS